MIGYPLLKVVPKGIFCLIPILLWANADLSQQ